MKFIREARFGPPKTYKTGSILNTYPTPIAYIAWDQGGHEITKRKYTKVSLADWKLICSGKLAPPTDITVIDCSFTPEGPLLDSTLAPVAEDGTFKKTSEAVNALVEGAGVYPNKNKAEKFPFKTVVGDSITELSKSILRWISKNQNAKLADARKWAGDTGAKVEQVISYLNSMATKDVCHVVTIFHNEIKENEDTKEIKNLPLVFSNLKYSVGGLYTQFFYQNITAGKPQVTHMAHELVNGVGARWPEFPAGTKLAGPTFDEIYGKVTDIYK